MKILKAVVAVLAASLLACAPPPPAPAPSAPAGESPDQMIADAKALDTQFVDAFNRGDIEGLMACYATGPDVVLMPPGMMEARGPEAIRAALTGALAGMAGGTLALTDTNYSAHGDAVLAWGLWRFTMPATATAPAAEMLGRFTQVSARRNGKLVYLMDHASVPMPPPPAPAAASGG